MQTNVSEIVIDVDRQHIARCKPGGGVNPFELAVIEAAENEGQEVNEIYTENGALFLALAPNKSPALVQLTHEGRVFLRNWAEKKTVMPGRFSIKLPDVARGGRKVRNVRNIDAEE